MSADDRRRVLVSSFQCKAGGASEGYSAYKWVEEIAKYHDVTLLTVDQTPVPEGVELVRPAERFSSANKLLRRLNGEIKLDYYRFDRASKKSMRDRINGFDLVHHVAPIAPRYPNSVGVMGKKFVLGPIGGCQRVPPGFRKDVEAHEETFFKLRLLDRLRLDHDPFLRKTYQSADRIILVGRFMLDVIPQEFHDKCDFMLETGINASEFGMLEKPDSNEGETLNLLYVGRVVPYKGLIYLLRALAALDERERKGIRLSVIGDRGEGAYERECRERVAASGLEPVVQFLGFRKKAEIVAYYQKSDLFVFPSLAETSGNVILEAMAVGCPAMVAACGGPADIVTDASGFLIEPRDPEQFVADMARVIRGLIGRRESLAEKRRESRALIERKFDWSRKGEVMRDWYREVLAAPPAQAPITHTI